MFVEEKSIVLLLCLCLASGFVSPSCRYLSKNENGSRVLCWTKDGKVRLNNNSMEKKNYIDDEAKKLRSLKKLKAKLTAREARIIGPFTAMTIMFFGVSEEARALTESVKFDQALNDHVSLVQDPTQVAKESTSSPLVALEPPIKSSVPVPDAEIMDSFSSNLLVPASVGIDSLPLSTANSIPAIESSLYSSILSELPSESVSPLLSLNNLFPAGLGLGTLAAFVLAFAKKKEVERLLWRENAYLDKANRYAEARMAVQKVAYIAKKNSPKSKAASRLNMSSAATNNPSTKSQSLQPTTVDFTESPSVSSESTVEQESTFGESTNGTTRGARGYLDALGKSSSSTLGNVGISNSKAASSSAKRTSSVVGNYLDGL